VRSCTSASTRITDLNGMASRRAFR
jgi:hypothetical protein